MPLYTLSIDIADECWICADAFIGPGAQLKKRTIIGARGVMFKNSIKDGIYIGNPAKFLKKRIINNEDFILISSNKDLKIMKFFLNMGFYVWNKWNI